MGAVKGKAMVRPKRGALVESALKRRLYIDKRGPSAMVPSSKGASWRAGPF